MTGRKAIVGICALCALLVGAVAAQSASAAGTTAYTCKEEAGGDFTDAHCKSKGTVGGSPFKHVAITKKTTITGSNDTTGTPSPVFLHSVQSGVEEELEATGVTGSGFMENKEEGGEMFAHGTGTLNYTGVTVVKPAGKGCKVKTGEVKTKELTATTKGQGDALKFTPASGEVFATFEIEGCSTSVLNGLYEVKGSITSSSIEGATTLFDPTQTTNQNTLKVRGQKAGLKGPLTIKGRDANDVNDPYQPLSVTT